MKLVVVINRSEFEYMVAWCEDKGFLTPYLGDPEKYPIAIGADGGWTDRMDRAADYVSFSSFIQSNAQISGGTPSAEADC